MKCAHCTKNRSNNCTEINHWLTPKKAASFALACLISLMGTHSWAQDDNTTATDTPVDEQSASASEQSESPAPAEPPPPPPYGSREERDMKLLAGEIRDQNSTIWLEGADGPFLALYEQEITDQPTGAVLILHAEGQHSNWPNTIELIRTSLPNHDWATLAMSLPTPDLPKIPERTLPANNTATPQQTDETAPPPTDEAENPDAATDDQAPDDQAPDQAEAGEENEIFDENTGTVTSGDTNNDNTSEPPQETEEPAATEPRIPSEEIAYSRIESAILYLNNELGIFNIVLLGDGIGAARAGNYLGSLTTPKPQKKGEKPIKPVRAMVILNGRNSSPMGDINLLTSLYDPEIPTLDIYFGLHQQDETESLARKKYAMRKGFTTYQQIQLPELSFNTMLGSNRLERRVRGFLQKHARGVRVDNVIVKER